MAEPGSGNVNETLGMGGSGIEKTFPLISTRKLDSTATLTFTPRISIDLVQFLCDYNSFTSNTYHVLSKVFEI